MGFALLPILVLSGFQTFGAFRTEAEERRQGLILAAELSAATVRARLDSAVVLLETIRPDSVGFACAPRLSSLVDRSSDVSGLFRYSATGRVVCASSDAGGIEAAAETNWFDRLRAGDRIVFTRAPSTLSPRPALLAAVRAERPMGRFDGALVALLPLDSLQPAVSERGLPEDGEVALTDARGVLLTATDASAFPPNPTALARSVRTAAAGRAVLVDDFDRQGRDRVYAATPLGQRDVFVVVSAPDPGWFSWARLDPIGVLLLPLMAWLVALLAVLVFSHRIVIRWLDYLERIAAIYAKGRFTVRPVQTLHAPSEIQVLGRTLDEMAESIVTRDRLLTHSLGEKDALLREIHHRVKNNLQIISSLLNLQQRALTDPAARAAIGDTKQRISALALIYRTLYQSDDIGHADLGVFLRELVGQLIAAEAGRGPVVASRVEAESLPVDPDKLAPISLWAVEAISNAQKHAFAVRGGSLAVRFFSRDGESTLEVEDDGPGRPESAAGGVGMTLMTAFAKQLRGRAEVLEVPSGGTLARLVFPTPEASTPNEG